jgi:hypothetical protein
VDGQGQRDVRNFLEVIEVITPASRIFAEYGVDGLQWARRLSESNCMIREDADHPIQIIVQPQKGRMTRG